MQDLVTERNRKAECAGGFKSPGCNAAWLMLTGPTGAGLLCVGHEGSREALGQVPEQQLAWRSSHASLKNKSKFWIFFKYKNVYVDSLTIFFFGMSLDLSAISSSNKLAF